MAAVDDYLRDWLSAYLGGEERVARTLTNRQSGVTREQGTDAETIEPAPEFGAVATVTDRRVLFLVGGAGDDGRDAAVSVPHEDVVGVDAVEELLTSQFVLTTTAETTWRFTACEADDLGAAVAYVDERMAGNDHVRATLERARDHRDAAAAADEPATRARQYDRAVESYRRAVERQTAPAVAAVVDPDSLRDEVVAAVRTAIDAHLAWTREARSRGNWDYRTGDEAAAYDHLSTALDAFDRAYELARDCPPGDADAIERERDALLAKLDALDIRRQVAAAGDD